MLLELQLVVLLRERPLVPWLCGQRVLRESRRLSMGCGLRGRVVLVLFLRDIEWMPIAVGLPLGAAVTRVALQHGGVAVGVALAALLSACSAASPVPPVDGDGLPFGRRCAATEQCDSALCVSTSAGSAVCSRACDDDADCPDAVNWGCVMPYGAAFRVCGCIADAAQEICEDGRDNDCDGIADDCRLCDDEMVSANDPLNCGECDNVCRGDQFCVEGECSCALFGERDCGGACVDTYASTSHCGGCDVRCGAGQVCEAGACVCPTAAFPDYCSGTCVNTDTSSQHCGQCGGRCGPGQTCLNGTCECPSGAASLYCGLAGCVDPSTNAGHCGGCGAACTQVGEVCASGSCQCPAATPDTCDGSCVALATDESHCGTCDTVCDPALLCVGGMCQCPASTHVFCDGVCKDPSSDAQHCGGCDLACGPGERCTPAGCECESGLYCNGTCVPPNDSANCGACGLACAAGQHCSGTTCACDVVGLTACGDACVQTANDPANCGGCDDTCRNTEVCTSGTCACPVGTTWCDVAGACVSLTTDSANCGTCGTVCPSGTACSAGACRCPGVNEIYCASVDGCVNRYTSTEHCGACDVDCENTEICSLGSCRCTLSNETYCASVDMCVNRFTSTSHCGACDNVCRNTELCSSGVCRCPTGTTYCASAGQCVSLSTNVAHCGACDAACAVDATCNTRVCTCADQALTHCDSTCVDTESDDAHCGACNAACAADRECAQGECLCQSPVRGARVVVADVPASAEDRIVVAALGNVVGVAWTNATTQQAFFRTYSATGVPQSTLHTFGSGTLPTEGVALTTNGTEFALSALSSPPGGDGKRLVRVVRFDAAGDILSDASIDFLVWDSGTRTSIAWAPTTGYAVAINDGTFGVVGPTGSSTPPLLSSIGAGDPTVAGLPGGGFAVVSVTTLPYLRMTDATGMVLGTAVQVGFPNTFGGFMSYSREVRLLHDGTSLVAVLSATRRALSGTIANHEVHVLRGAALENEFVAATHTNQDTNVSALGGLGADVSGGQLYVTYARQEGLIVGQMARFGARYALPVAVTAAPVVLNPPALWSATFNARERLPSLAVTTAGAVTSLTESADGDPGVELQPVSFPACAP